MIGLQGASIRSRGMMRAQRGIARRYNSTLPPPPTSASTSRPKSRKWLKRTAVVVGLGGSVYVYDKTLNASALTRSLRTGWIGLVCTLDYKINFAPHKADQIEQLHQRVADRLRWVIDTNQGLYLKLGQALGLQAALLPKPYREAFGHVFDRAPSVPYPEVQHVFARDLNKQPEELFESFSEEPLASASIAQVHKARLKLPGGERVEVAVKVQKPAIEKQMEWDLFSYRSLMWLCEKIFDMPMYFVTLLSLPIAPKFTTLLSFFRCYWTPAPEAGSGLDSSANYVSSQMRLETSFKNEANNARKCAELLEQTPELRDKVYIPRVYGQDEGCAESDRIMVMEWVDGVRDKDHTWSLRHPFANREANYSLNDKTAIEKMGLNVGEVMDIAISTMSAMTFSWGFVHCDPHPGNLLVRQHPTKKGKPQLVLIDHGLYITLPKQFREDYCTLWRSLFVLDVPQIERIAGKWGIALDANMFASAILLRPSQVRKQKQNKKNPQPEKSQYEQQVELKRRFKTMLENEQLIPRELIFLTRCQRMMQANNQLLGSPSSRVNLTAKWASIGYNNSITDPRTISRVGLGTWLRDRLNTVIFRITLGIIDLAFWTTQFRQKFLPKHKQEGWEDKLQHQFEHMAKEEFGIEIDDTVFLG